MRRRLIPGGATLVVLLLLLSLLSGCGGTSATQAAPAPRSSPVAAGSSVAGGTEVALAPEQNPAGDIPDNQVFVSYTPPSGGYAFQVPEGWAQAATASGATFTDKFNGIAVDVTSVPSVPTTQSVQTTVVPILERSGKAVQIVKVEQITLPAGPAIRLTYTANSDPNPVTGKQVRLENERYLFFKNGTQAALTLWAPQGADNVDQWQQIVKSFRWTA